jgi:hypothetical protein
LQLGPTNFLTKARVQAQEVEALVLSMLRMPPQNVHAPALTVSGLQPFMVPSAYDQTHTHHR